jgi:hypothetical protein
MRNLIRLLFLLVTALPAGEVAANELACTWQPLAASNSSGDPGARDMAKFYSKPGDFLYFRLFPDRERVEHADSHKTQEIVYPQLRLSVAPERFIITVPEPNVPSLKGRRAQVHIQVNRFTLQSTMVLEMAEKADGRLVAYWLREGQCYKRVF